MRCAERASRWIAKPFVERRRAAAAFTSSEPFPSTFQIMHERSPRPVPRDTVLENPCRYVSCESPHAREFPPSLSLSRSLFPRAAHTTGGVQSSYRFTGEERDPRPDNEIGEATSEAVCNLDALNTLDDRAPPIFPIQTSTGYFRTDVRRVEFNYGRVLGRAVVLILIRASFVDFFISLAYFTCVFLI